MPTLDEILAGGGSLGTTTTKPAVDTLFAEDTTVTESLAANNTRLMDSSNKRERDLGYKSFGFLEQAGMSIYNRNSVGNVVRALSNQRFEEKNPPEEGFDKWGYLESLGVPAKDRVDIFGDIDSKAVIDRTLEQVQKRRQNNEIVAANGVEGILASMFAEVTTEPLNLVFFARGVQGAKLGAALKESAVRVGAEGAVSEAAIQSVMVATQPDKSLGTAASEVAAATVGSALLGAGGTAFGRAMGWADNKIAEAVVNGVTRGPIETTSVGKALGDGYGSQVAPTEGVGAAKAPNEGLQVNRWNEGLRLKGGPLSQKIIGTLGNISPSTRTLLSQSEENAIASSFLWNTGLQRDGGVVSAAADVTQEQMFGSMAGVAKKKSNELFYNYVGVGENPLKRAAVGVGDLAGNAARLTRKEVNELVGMAMRRNDTIEGVMHPSGKRLSAEDVKVVDDIAAMYRKDVMEPMKERLIQAELLDPEVSAEYADSYIMRKYNIAEINASPEKWADSVRPAAERVLSEQKEATEVAFNKALDTMSPAVRKELGIKKGARNLDEANFKDLSPEAQAKFEKLADLEKNARLFLSDEYAEEFIADMTNQWAQHITTGGSAFKAFEPKTRGPMKARVLPAMDSEIESFLVSDIDEVVEQFLRVSTGEYALKTKFGTTKFEDIFGEAGKAPPEGVKLNLTESKITGKIKLAKEWDAKIAEAKTPEQAAKLEVKKKEDLNSYTKRVNAEIADLETGWELIRGTYKSSNMSPDHAVRRGISAIKALTTMAYLGGVVLSQLADLVTLRLAHSFSSVLGDGYAPMVKSLMDPKVKAALRANMDDLNAAAIGLESLNNSRLLGLMGNTGQVADKTGIERGIEGLAGKFGDITGMNAMNDMGQVIAGNVAMARIFKLANGERAVTPKDVVWLKELGIDENILTKVNDQLGKYGYKEGNMIAGNITHWDNRELADIVNRALYADNKNAILRAGSGDTPIVMNNIWGKTLGMFMTFAMVANNRILLKSVQKKDADVLMALTSMVAAGSMSYYLKSLAAGREPSDDWRVWMVEGIKQSGVATLLVMGNDNIAEPMGLGLNQLTRDKETYNKEFLGSGGGAPISFARDVLKAGKGVVDLAVTGETSKGNVKAMQSTVPFGRLPPIKWALDKIFEPLKDE